MEGKLATANLSKKDQVREIKPLAVHEPASVIRRFLPKGRHPLTQRGAPQYHPRNPRHNFIE